MSGMMFLQGPRHGAACSNGVNRITCVWAAVLDTSVDDLITCMEGCSLFPE